MGNGPANVDDQEFYWSASDEPHASRRKAILEDHPEIKDLAGKIRAVFSPAFFCFRALLYRFVESVRSYIINS